MTAIRDVLNKISKQFEDDIVAKLDREQVSVPMVSTGVRALDRAIAYGTVSGIGGFPRGCVTTLFGPESGGKSTMGLWSIGKLIAAGGTGVYIDVEQGGSEEYVFACLAEAGAPIEEAIEEDRLVILRPHTAEAVMVAAKALVPHADLMFIDSISVMMSQAELDAAEGKLQMGLKARFQTTEFNKLNAILGASNCALVIISQIRMAIATWGGYETTTEPNAVRHLASVRVRLSKDSKGMITRDGEPFAQAVSAEIKKNKFGAPGMTCGLDIVFGHGIDMTRDVLETAAMAGVIRRGGSTYYYPAEEGGAYLMKESGYRSALEFLQENPEITKQIESEL